MTFAISFRDVGDDGSFCASISCCTNSLSETHCAKCLKASGCILTAAATAWAVACLCFWLNRRNKSRKQLAALPSYCRSKCRTADLGRVPDCWIPLPSRKMWANAEYSSFGFSSNSLYASIFFSLLNFTVCSVGSDFGFVLFTLVLWDCSCFKPVSSKCCGLEPFQTLCSYLFMYLLLVVCFSCVGLLSSSIELQVLLFDLLAPVTREYV